MPMPPFTPQSSRYDPYKNFKFRLCWAGSSTPIAGISKVSALRRSTDPIRHREGADPSTDRVSPGRTHYEAITLERGVTHDDAFEIWINKVWNYRSGPGTEVSLKDFRRDLVLHLCNEAGQVVIGYNIYRCWVSQYTALPELDANGGAIAIQSITLENEGWHRDPDITQPDSAYYEGMQQP